MRTREVVSSGLTAAVVAIVIGVGAADRSMAADQTLRFGHMWPPESGWGQAS